MKVDSREMPGLQAVRLLLGGLTWQPMSISSWSTRSRPGEIFVSMGPTCGPGIKTAATTTDFPTTVQVPLNQIALLDSLTVTVDIFDSNDAMLGLKLIAPDGDSITLFTNQTLGGDTVTVRGISGANVGENNGFLVGTTFTDAAARSIVDISPTGGRGASAPYIGDFRVEDDIFVNDPDGRTLTAFLNKVLADDSINGTWELETIDSNTSAPSTPSSVDFWTLNLSTGMKPDLDVQVPGHSWAYRCRFSLHYVPDHIGCFADRH